MLMKLVRQLNEPAKRYIVRFMRRKFLFSHLGFTVKKRDSWWMIFQDRVSEQSSKSHSAKNAAKTFWIGCLMFAVWSVTRKSTQKLFWYNSRSESEDSSIGVLSLHGFSSPTSMTSLLWELAGLAALVLLDAGPDVVGRAGEAGALDTLLSVSGLNKNRWGVDLDPLDVLGSRST